jgi:hypothetical protein
MKMITRKTAKRIVGAKMTLNAGGEMSVSLVIAATQLPQHAAPIPQLGRTPPVSVAPENDGSAKMTTEITTGTGAAIATMADVNVIATNAHAVTGHARATENASVAAGMLAPAERPPKLVRPLRPAFHPILAASH